MNQKLNPSFTEWQLRSRLNRNMIITVAVCFLLLSISAARVDVYKGFGLVAEGAGEAVGLVDESDIGTGWKHFYQNAFPLVFAEKTDVNRIANFDSNHLPPMAYLIEEPVRSYNALADTWEISETKTFLVEPYGYLWRVLGLMLQTIEIAIWGTLLCIIISIPLALLATSNYTPHWVFYHLSRALCSFNRAVPELISAMFLVLMFGFGALPGIIALGIHTSGFLGKFFADDIENVEKGVQDALKCTGVNRIQVLRFTVIPQVLPQYMGYIQYILERNVRSATVLGIVGAGGIGMELKGRWDLSDFGHVSTILLIVFITVFVLENITQYARLKFIQ